MINIFPSKKSAVFILLFSGLIFLTGCTDEKQESKHVVKDGLIYNQQGNLFSGIIRDSLMNRFVEYEVLEGVKNGSYKVFFKDGKPEMQGQMKNNKNEGKWKYYYPGGQIECEGVFNNDLVEDKWNWYHLNGNLKETGLFRNGKREGPWFMYNVDGEVIDYAEFINGEKRIVHKN